MREIRLNGYIDDELWFGDEITPETLHGDLYQDGVNDDVRIVLNSYGGSCNAAVRMYDDIRAYPGNVHLIISGTAASAATILSMAANRVEITPGSLFMIHDPLMGAYGNEADMNDAIGILRACKESILNIYMTRSNRSREEIASMMTASTWMDANQALEYGFVDGIVEQPWEAAVTDSTFIHAVDKADAIKKFNDYADRRKHNKVNPAHNDVPQTPPANNEPESKQDKGENTVNASDLQKRLEMLKYTY